ncbi:hypothetical protein HMN09_00366300 [Mycena chlorophos]|uniref:C2H2-type domain-containing protein n=1 Tax=Mycena chlorophos TaxID=658473 RepID=A0A8H6TGQ1_MYCCL|nr:hypothetical protein HMN09_00366300 [Mycena chlorophos]
MPSPTVVLPSIHEMFPDYLLAAKPPSASAPAASTAAPQPPPPAPFLGGLPPRNHYLPAPMPPPLTLRFAFDAHPPSSSPTLLRSPTSTGSTVADGDRDGDSAESASDGQLSNEDDDDDEDGSSSPTSTRKHICPQCGKRFNRPSSLRIHVNTHTGATPASFDGPRAICSALCASFRTPTLFAARCLAFLRSTTTTTRTMSPTQTGLPSLNELLPERLFEAAPAVRRARATRSLAVHPSIPSPRPNPAMLIPRYSFDILKPRPSPFVPVACPLPPASVATISIPDADETESVSDGVSMDEDEEDDADGDYKPGKGVPGLQIWSKSGGRKHACGQCGKRFNRPSSLRIHLNTHSGATPFPCPYPRCGRTFNVKSNMRRHQRNHLELEPLSPSATTTAVPSSAASSPCASLPSPPPAPGRALAKTVPLPVHPYMQMTRPQPRPRPPRMPPPSYHDPHARKPSRCPSPAQVSLNNSPAGESVMGLLGVLRA